MKARLYVDVEFNGRKTDAEGIASAMDNVVKCGMSALGDCWHEYGGAPRIGEVFVLDTEAAVEHTDAMQALLACMPDIDQHPEITSSMRDAITFLRQVAGKK
jgi:hypothetical protein